MDATLLWPTPRNFVRSLRCSIDALVWGPKQTFRLLAPLVAPFVAPFVGDRHAHAHWTVTEERAAPAEEGAGPAAEPAVGTNGRSGGRSDERSDDVTDATGVPLVAEITVPAVPEPAETVGTGADPVDDLTVIDGVGPKLAQRLNTAGVSSFAALAAWQPGDIERFEETLPPVQRGRLEREGWIGQARLLALRESSAAG